MSGVSTTSIPGPPSSSIARSARRSRDSRPTSSAGSRSIIGLLLQAPDGHAVGALALLDEREHDAEHAVLVGRRGFLGVDVGVQPDHAPEWAGLDLELLVDAPLGLLNRAFTADHELATGDLEADRGQIQAAEVRFHHGPRRLLAAVVDV